MPTNAMSLIRKATLFLLFCQCHSVISPAEEWPHFLGPHGDTSVREVEIRTEFPELRPDGAPVRRPRAMRDFLFYGSVQSAEVIRGPRL